MTAAPLPHDTARADPPLKAARLARAIAGEEAGCGEARRDAFAALLYGLATGFEMRTPGAAPDSLPERVDALATRLVREVLGTPFREASRLVEAVADALVAEPGDPALVGTVHAGAAAATDWLDGDARGFEARVLQATAGESFASDRALRGRR